MTIDVQLSPTSHNAVQNKAIYSALETVYDAMVDLNAGVTEPTKFGLTAKDLIGDFNDDTGVYTPSTGNIDVVMTGVQDVAAYALADKFNYTNSINSVTFPDLTSVTGNYSFGGAFTNCKGLTELSFPNLVSITGTNAFYMACSGCTNLTTVSFPSLTTIGNGGLYYTFDISRSNLTTVDLSALQTVGYEGLYLTFGYASNLTSINLSSLVSVANRGMDSCFRSTGLTTISFSSLTTLGEGALRYAFQDCSNLDSIYFPALTTLPTMNSYNHWDDPFYLMCNDRTKSGCVVHLPSNLESVIGSWESVTSGFYYNGGNSSVVAAFDLPATS